MSYFGKDFDRMCIVIVVLAVVGFIALLVGAPLLLIYLWQHLRFA